MMTLKPAHDGAPMPFHCHDCGCQFSSNYAAKVHRHRTGHYVKKEQGQ